MYATNVRNLKRNPSEALRQAEHEPVLILKGNQPNALLLNLQSSLGDLSGQLKPALASVLFKDQVFVTGCGGAIKWLEPVRIYRSFSTIGYRCGFSRPTDRPGT
jgi:hypothetical protein